MGIINRFFNFRISRIVFIKNRFVYNVVFYKDKDPNAYNKALKHLVNETKKGKMFGEWNDYGRLLEE